MESLNKIPVIAVLGPTASGKTRLAVELALKYGGEIVSADSMQIYKYMDIATAKPTAEETRGIPHHLIDFLPPDKPFSVADYVDLAREKILDIYSRGKTPIIAGGTGLYASSLLSNIVFTPSGSDEVLRSSLERLAKEQGVERLLQILSEFDPESAERLGSQKNTKRIIRAIEIYKTTGKTMTESISNSRPSESPYNAVKIGLTAEQRSFLYNRINKRVDIMLSSGLIEETKRIMSLNLGKTAKMAIGYKELIPYINGEVSYEYAVEELKKETRRYAKRQLTWFGRDKEISWLYIDKANENEIIDAACKIIDNKGVLNRQTG